MADFKKLIDNKAESAQYMIDGIKESVLWLISRSS